MSLSLRTLNRAVLDFALVKPFALYLSPELSLIIMIYPSRDGVYATTRSLDVTPITALSPSKTKRERNGRARALFPIVRTFCSGYR